MEVIRTAQLDAKRKDRESKFMGEYWTFRKAVGTPEESQAYWNQVIQGSNYLISKYGKDEAGNEDYYLQSMVLNLIHDLEARRVSKKDYGLSLKCFNQMRAGSGLPLVVEQR